MEQISLPMRIALAAALAFAALWFVALRPKPVDVDGPLPVAAEAAKETKASTPAKADAVKSEPKAAQPAAQKNEPQAAEKAAPKTGPEAVLADIKARRTTVLLFFHPSAASSDDQAVRAAVRDIDRHGGKVRVHTATIGQIGKYEAITKAATIQSTPTVLVIDRQAQVRSIQGLTVTREIDALVDRALKVK